MLGQVRSLCLSALHSDLGVDLSEDISQVEVKESQVLPMVNLAVKLQNAVLGRWGTLGGQGRARDEGHNLCISLLFWQHFRKQLKDKKE